MKRFLIVLLTSSFILSTSQPLFARSHRGFIVSRSALSKTVKIAKRVARRKAWKAAKKHCRKRRTQKLYARWSYSCHRKGRFYRCVARNRFRCLRHQSKRSKRRSRHLKKKSHVRSAIAQGRTLKSAKKKARKKVYRRAKKVCKHLKVTYVKSWSYRCKKRGRYYRCRAKNTFRCSSKHHLRKHRRHRRRKYRHRTK